MNAALDEWLKDRPQIIKKMVSLFPPGTKIHIDGITHYVISYFEDGSLGVSEVNPAIDYDAAIESSHMLCRDCINDLIPAGVN